MHRQSPDTLRGPSPRALYSVRNPSAYLLVDSWLTVFTHQGANQTLSSALTNALEKTEEEDVDMAEAGPSSRPAGGQKILVARISSRGCMNKRSALRSVIQAVIASDQAEADEETRVSRLRAMAR